MRVTIFLILLAMAGSSADAAKWRLVSKAADGTVVSIDVASVRRDGGKPQAWIKLDRRQIPGSQFAEARTLWRLDCARNLSAVLSSTSYDAKGMVRATKTYPDVARAYEPIVPDSYAATVHGLLCR